MDFVRNEDFKKIFFLLSKLCLICGFLSRKRRIKQFKWFNLLWFWIDNENLRVLKKWKVIEGLDSYNWKVEGLNLLKKIIEGPKSHINSVEGSKSTIKLKLYYYK